MDLPFTIVSVIAILIVIVLYFLTRAKRMKAHKYLNSQGRRRTFIPQSNLSIGAALVVLGIIMNIGNQAANYGLIGAGLILAIIDAVKILK
jgi:hypothetical protein